MPRYVSFNRKELREKFPDLAAALEQLFESDKKKFQFNIVDYIGKNKKGKHERRVGLGWIIETLDNYGYEVTISISKEGKRISAQQNP